MSQPEFSMPQPGPEHALVLKGVGEWNVESLQYCEPGKPPMKTASTDSVVAVGGFWTLSHYRADMMGMPFEGRATFGYDVIRKKYVSTWIDSMMPNLWIFEGDYDAKTKTFTLLGKGPDMTCSGLCDWKIIHTQKSDDQHVMSMCVCTPGGDVTTLQNTYTRKK